ncbi:MAG: hypothetical protein JSS70_05720 [Bacteroidetes bacterium]|nr:hypothetical protein [Bacteroidota bacterium]
MIYNRLKAELKCRGYFSSSKSFSKWKGVFQNEIIVPLKAFNRNRLRLVEWEVENFQTLLNILEEVKNGVPPNKLIVLMGWIIVGIAFIIALLKIVFHVF